MGVDWWQTLLVAVTTPAVTAAALIWQNQANNDRDGRRRADEAAERERERESIATREARVRSQAIHDFWRGERRQAHVAYLASLELVNAEFVRQIMNADRDSAKGLRDDVLRQVREHLAGVQLLSLPSTRLCAEEAFEMLVETNLKVFTFRVSLGPMWTTDDQQRSADADSRRMDLNVARAAYLNAARIELGAEEGHA